MQGVTHQTNELMGIYVGGLYMVSIMKKQRIKATRDEALFLVDAAERIAWHGEKVLCPRCGKILLYDEVGNSYTVACSDEECISIDCRGI